MESEVVITGMGVISALGDEPGAVYRARCKGDSAIRLHEFPEREERMLGAAISSFDAEVYLPDDNLRPLDRAGRLAVSSSKLALKSAGLRAEDCEKVEVDIALGTMFCGAHTISQFDRKAQVSGPRHAMPLEFANTVLNAAAGQTAIWHNLRGNPMTLAAGDVSGLRAVEYAARRISLGWSELFLAGGIDEHCFETSLSFRESGHASDGSDLGSAQPFGRSSRGFAPGEGAAFLVLESADSARNRGADVVGKIAGWGASYAPAEASADRRRRATLYAVEAALKMANRSASEIGYVSCSADGRTETDALEAKIIGEVLGERVGSVPIAVPAESLGNTLGASGVFNLVEAIETSRGRVLPPFRGARNGDLGAPDLRLVPEERPCAFDLALVLACGMGGNVSALLLSLDPD